MKWDYLAPYICLLIFLGLPIMLIFSYIDYENKGTYRYPTQNEWNLHNNGISSNNISMCLEIDPRAAEGKGR